MKKAMCAIVFVSLLIVSAAAGQVVAPVVSTDQVAVSDAATLIKATPATSEYRYSIIVKNTGANTVWIGSSRGVTSANGFPLTAGQYLTLDRSWSDVYAICGAGLASTIAYLEEAR
ncbi:MAG: hypothetical protein AB9866_10960 [Syntrophobacteraceae bacterium]